MAEDVKIVISAVDKTKKAFGGVTKGLQNVAKAAFSMKSALALAAGGLAIGYMIKQSLTAVDTLKKTADKIGTTTEQLSKLQYAAELTGVKTETVNMAMQRFTRRLSEATKGTGEAKGALRTLNIDADKLIKMPLDEQMFVLADAFGDVNTSAEKVALAMKLFDSEGVSLVNTLAQGRDGLKGMFDEAEKLGVVLSTRASSGIETANDALLKLFTLFRGIRDQITAALAPAITTLTTLIKDKLLAAFEKAGSTIEEFANKFVKDAIVGLGNLIIGFGAFVETLTRFANDIAYVFLKVKGYFDETTIAVKNTFSMDNANKIKALGAQIVTFGELSAFAFGEVTKLNKETERTPNIFNKWGDSLKAVSEQMPSLAEHMSTVSKAAAGSLTDALTSAISGAKSFGEAMKDMAKSVIDSLIKMMVQYWIVQPLFNAIGGALGMPTTAATGKAIGGSVQNGQPYMVGERGPEMFVPNQSGSIVPNGSLGGGGGVTVNQTINVSTGVQQTVRAEIATLMPQIANAAKGAVADARQRGGGFSKSLVGA